MIIQDYPKLKEKFPTSSSLFDFDYQEPEVYSAEDIEAVIYNHYKNYRMSYDAAEDEENEDTECLDEWHDDFAARMQELMQSYAPLFDSLELVIDPLRTVDITIDDEHQRKMDKVASDLRSIIDSQTGSESRSRSDSHSEDRAKQDEIERASAHEGSEIEANDRSSRDVENLTGQDSKTTSSEHEDAEQSMASTNASNAENSSGEQSGESIDLKNGNSTSAGATYGNASKNGELAHKESDMPQGSVANVDELNYLSKYTHDANGNEDNNSSISTTNSKTGEENNSLSSTINSSERQGSSEQITEGQISKAGFVSGSESSSNSSEKIVAGTEAVDVERQNASQDSELVNQSGSEHASGSSSGSESLSSSHGSEQSSEGQTAGTEDESGTAKSHRYGYEGIPAEILKLYREGIVNYNLMIVREFADFFLQVWR